MGCGGYAFLTMTVDGVLGGGDDVLPLEHRHRVVLGEQPGDGATVDAVALALELAHLLEERVEVLHGLEPLEQADVGRRHAHQHVAQLGHLGHGLADLEHVQEVGDVEHVVGDVVEALRDVVDVLAVERRHEARVQPGEHVTRQIVALAFGGEDGVALGTGVRQVGHHLLQQLGALVHVVRRLDEQVEELVVGRDEPESHGGVLSPQVALANG